AKLGFALARMPPGVSASASTERPCVRHWRSLASNPEPRSKGRPPLPLQEGRWFRALATCYPRKEPEQHSSSRSALRQKPGQAARCVAVRALQKLLGLAPHHQAAWWPSRINRAFGGQCLTSLVEAL